MNNEEWEASIERVGVVVGCLVKQDDKYLFVQENQKSARGLWNLPAGHVDKCESLEEAAKREVKEETGYDVRLFEQIALYHEAASKSVKHVYSAEIVGGTLAAQKGEIQRVEWLSFEEVEAIKNDGKLRAPWVWDTIRNDHQAA